MYVTLQPAYGRDYKTAAAVTADWNADKDFIISSIGHQFDGKPINRSQSLRTSDKYTIRFFGSRKTIPVK